VGKLQRHAFGPVTPLDGIRRKSRHRQVLYRAAATWRQHAELRDHSSSRCYRRRRWTRQWAQGRILRGSSFDGKRYSSRAQTWPDEEQTGAKPPAILQPLFTRTMRKSISTGGQTPRADLNATISAFAGPDSCALRFGPISLGGYGRNAFEIYLDGKLVTTTTPCTKPLTAMQPLSSKRASSIRFASIITSMAMRGCACCGRVRPARTRGASRPLGRPTRVLVLGCRRAWKAKRCAARGRLQGRRPIDIGLPAAQQKLMEESSRSASRWCWCC